MLSCGLTPAQVDRVLAPGKVSSSSANTTVSPDNDLVTALSPDTRAKLYHELGRSSENEHMRFPFCYSGNAFVEAFATNGVSAVVTEMVRKLMYAQRGESCNVLAITNWCCSKYADK